MFTNHNNLAKILLCYLIISPAQLYGQQPAPRQLQGVIVTAGKPLIERKPGVIIMHVSTMLTAAGANALEVLEQAPGVQVAGDQLYLKGKPGVNIFIDGKPISLQGSELSAYLQSISGAMIDKIEIMPQPPAGYDAAGNAGIINIILKKEKLSGFNAQLMSENIQGRYARITQNGSFNYKTSRINFYGNVDNYNGTGYNNILKERSYPGTTGLTGIVQHGFYTSTMHRLLAKSGVDWKLSSSTHLSASLSDLYTDLHSRNSSDALENYAKPQGDSLHQSTLFRQRYTNNLDAYTEIKHQFDTSGHELSVAFSYLRYTRGQRWRFADSLPAAMPATVNTYSVKADYQRPFSKFHKIAVGYKSGFMNCTANDGFRYNDAIHAFYTSYSWEAGRFSGQAGLRMEHTNISTHQTGLSFTNRYTQLFPSLQLTLKKKDHQFNLSYSRRIDRPDYNNLNPAIMPMDSYNYEQGNPLLRPQLADNAEVDWLYKNIFSISVSYSHLRDNMEEITTVKDYIFYSSFSNTGNKDIGSIALEGTLAPAPWWKLSPNLQFTYTQYRSQLFNEPIYRNGPGCLLTVNQQFIFRDNWSAEIFTTYSSSMIFLQYIQAPNWYMHAGIRKKVLKDKGSLLLNMRDVFHSRRDKQYFDRIHGAGGFDNRIWDTRSVTIAFSYRISRGTRITNQEF